MRETSKFYSSLGLLIFLNAIIKPLWIFGIDREVQNIVGTDAYGTYFSLLNFSIVFSFLLDWGFTAYYNKELAAKESTFSARAGGFLLIKILFALAYAAILFTVAWISGITNWWILAYVCGIQVLTSLFVFLRAMITAKQWFRTDAWLSILDKTLMIILCGLLIYAPGWMGRIDLERFLQVQTACTLIAVIICWILLVSGGMKFNLDRGSEGRLYHFSKALPYAFTVLLMSTHYRADGFLLERIHDNGAYEAGIYASAYRLLDAANMIGYLVASFLLPFVARQWSKGKAVDSVILSSRHLMAVFSIFTIVTILFLAPWIEELLYRRTDENAAVILQWTIPALTGYAMVQIYGTILTATGRIHLFCRINLIAVVINITLNIILIPGWGAQGCCIAALVSQLFCGIASVYFANKKTGATLDIPSIIIYIFITGLLCLLYTWGSNENLGPWLLIGLAALVTLVASVTGKILDISKWRRLIRQSET